MRVRASVRGGIGFARQIQVVRSGEWGQDYFAKNPMEPYCVRNIQPKLQSYKVRSSLRAVREVVEAAEGKGKG